jgi:hypothetical protein
MRGAENVTHGVIQFVWPEKCQEVACRLRSLVTADSRQSAVTQLLQPAGVLLPISVAQCSYELLVGKERLSFANLSL